MIRPRVEKGRFVNPLPIQRPPPPHGGEMGAEPAWRDFREWRRSRPSHPKTIDLERAPPVERLAAAPASGIAATWIGHSSVVLQLDGKTYLCDPVWSNRLAGGFVVPRYTPPGIPWSALPHVDALLISHNHYDHLDAPTIRRLPRGTPVFCGTNLGPWFASRGFTNVTERSWWESTRLDGHKLTFVPAQHFSARTPWDRDRTLWGGWVVEGHEGSVAYHAGDSGYWDGFKMIGDTFPRIDLAMIPIGAYLPRWFMAPVHVDPPEGGQAYRDTRARAMLPIHWGAFRLADERLDEPPNALRKWWNEERIDNAKLRVPALGETITMHA